MKVWAEWFRRKLTDGLTDEQLNSRPDSGEDELAVVTSPWFRSFEDLSFISGRRYRWLEDRNQVGEFPLNEYGEWMQISPLFMQEWGPEDPATQSLLKYMLYNITEVEKGIQRSSIFGGLIRETMKVIIKLPREDSVDPFEVSTLAWVAHGYCPKLSPHPDHHWLIPDPVPTKEVAPPLHGYI